MAIEEELQSWLGPGWTVTATMGEFEPGKLSIRAEHRLSHGVGFDGLRPEEAIEKVTSSPGLGEIERRNVAAAPAETPHHELLMGVRVMIDGERLDAHDRDAVATVFRGVGLLTRDEADWVRVIEPLL